MKPRFFFILLLKCLFVGQIQSQDLSQLYTIAHWPLLTGPEDALDLQDTVLLDNVTLDPSLGAYSNGIYYSSNPETGSYIRTPHLESLFDTVFAVQLQFMIETLDGEQHPILVIGESYRYLGFELRFDNTFYILLNNGIHIPVIGVTANAGVFYDLTMIHDAHADSTEVYLNGIFIAGTSGELIRDENDGAITNNNFSNGKAFLGYWRNLRVYASEEVTALRAALSRNTPIGVFPNPASTRLHFLHAPLSFSRWSVSDQTGRIRLAGTWEGPEREIDISPLTSGMYYLQVFDKSGNMTGHTAFARSE